MNGNQVSAASNSAEAFEHPTYSPALSARNQWLHGPSPETSPDEEVVEQTTIVDVSYDRQRASEERTAALQSRDVRVRRVHAQLAEQYEERVRQAASSSQCRASF